MAQRRHFNRPGRKLTPEEVREKVRENKARRVLARRWGYFLVKSRRRDPQAHDYGCYFIVDTRRCVVVGHDFGWPDMSLSDVEATIRAWSKPKKTARARRTK